MSGCLSWLWQDTQLAVHGPPSLMFARPVPRGDDMSLHSASNTPLPFFGDQQAAGGAQVRSTTQT